MGLLSSWLCSECAVDQNSKGFKFLQSNHGLPKGKDGADRLVESIVSAINKENSGQITTRNAENIVCKAFRATRHTDERFEDLITKGQHVYEIIPGGVVVHRGNGTKVLIVGGLVKKWNWCNGMIQMDTLFQLLKPKLDGNMGNFAIPVEFRQNAGGRYVHEHCSLFFARS